MVFSFRRVVRVDSYQVEPCLVCDGIERPVPDDRVDVLGQVSPGIFCRLEILKAPGQSFFEDAVIEPGPP